MPLDFILLGTITFVLYISAYLLLRAEIKRLGILLSGMEDMDQGAKNSFLLHWAFRARGKSQDKLSRMFTFFPPLMLIVTASGIFLVFLTAIAFLNVATSIGTLVVVLMLAYPYYRATDAFDMLLMSRAAHNVGPSNLSKEDVTMLELAQKTLQDGMRYFSRLSEVILPLLILATVISPFVNPFLNSLYPDIGEGLLSFIALVSAVSAATLTTPTFHMEPESDQTREIALPMAGDHLSYRTVPGLDAARARLLRRFRLREENEASSEEMRQGS